jgi:hypothetical protein
VDAKFSVSEIHSIKHVTAFSTEFDQWNTSNIFWWIHRYDTTFNHLQIMIRKNISGCKIFKSLRCHAFGFTHVVFSKKRFSPMSTS